MSAHEHVDAAYVAARWPWPSADDDKYSRGVVGIIAGSDVYPGAAALCVSGAVRSGAGLVRYVGPRRAQDVVLLHRPEAVVYEPGHVAESLPTARAWVLGPGVAHSPDQDLAVGAVLASGAPYVADAGALDDVVTSRAAGARQASPDTVLLTPHEGELVRALAALRHDVTPEDVRRDRAAHARLLAEAGRATVLLKGSRTVIASPGGALLELPDAPATLASAGTGDVLAGVAGRLLAAGLRAAEAGAMAAWLHARAAAVLPGPIAALDLATALPQVLAALEGDRR